MLTYRSTYRSADGVRPCAVRRGAISSESLDPSNLEVVTSPKSVHEKEQIKQFIRGSPRFLFKHTSEERVNQIADVMKKQPVANGVTVIQEGEDGDLFYLVADGELEVFRKRGENAEEKVAHYGP